MLTTLRLYAVITAILDTCVASIASSRWPYALCVCLRSTRCRTFLGGLAVADVNGRARYTLTLQYGPAVIRSGG